MTYGSARKQYAAEHTGKHVPNKEEAKELRRIQQKSGLSEEEVRAQKTYRRQLAKASSNCGNGKNAFRLEMRRLRRFAAEELGTHINDPRVETLAAQKYREKQNRYPWR